MSPLRINIWLSFSQADLDPTSAQALLFFGFLKSLELFFRRFVLIASGAEILWRISWTFKPCFGNIAFPLSPVLVLSQYLHAVLPAENISDAHLSIEALVCWATGKRVTNRVLPKVSLVILPPPETARCSRPDWIYGSTCHQLAVPISGGQGEEYIYQILDMRKFIFFL